MVTEQAQLVASAQRQQDQWWGAGSRTWALIGLTGRRTAWQRQVPRQYIDFMLRHWPIRLSETLLARWTLPTQCLACHAWPCSEVLCHRCWARFHSPAFRCTGCALTLPGLSAERPCCGRCLRHPPPWTRAYAWADYSYPWSSLITRWKFAQQPALARHFARWMEQDPHIQSMLQAADLVIPIPLSPQRIRERGYNPAAQIARQLGESKCQLQLLIRQLHTEAQSGLTRVQRMRNLKNAFAVPANQKHHLPNQKVLLVDDVMTTGATLRLASRCLLQAGASQVHVLCMARTP